MCCQLNLTLLPIDIGILKKTIVDQNFNLNNAEQADVDGDEDMDITQEEQYRPFCQNLYTQVLLFRFCTKKMTNKHRENREKLP